MRHARWHQKSSASTSDDTASTPAKEAERTVEPFYRFAR
jgi:hypothetical protein